MLVGLTLLSVVFTNRRKTRMVSGRAAADSHLCVLSPNKYDYSDRSFLMTVISMTIIRMTFLYDYNKYDYLSFFLRSDQN